MTEVEFESDAFLSLLTDALRSGPGSPAWHEAIRRLRAGGLKQADEYRLLVRAREHLESGKDYRSIRAGPGFAQRLMAAIEEDSRASSTPPASAVAAVLSAAVMLLVLLAIGYLLWTASQHHGAGGGLLLSNVASDPDLATLPEDWHRIGQFQVVFRDKTMLPPRFSVAVPGAAVVGGGIVWNQTLPSDEPFSIAVTVRVRQLEPNVIAQVFVSDDPDFNPDNGTTPHELVWLLEDREAQVISPSGRVEAQTMIAADYKGFIPLLVTMDHDQASVDFDSKRLWSGPSGLDHDKPRYIGLRFLRRSGDAGINVVFQSLRINTRPQ